MKKFKTETYYPAAISEVECVREAKQTVWIVWCGGERKYSKQSDYTQFHDTWEAAHAYLLKRAEKKLINARDSLARAQGEHGNVVGMKKPAEPL